MKWLEKNFTKTERKTIAKYFRIRKRQQRAENKKLLKKQKMTEEEIEKVKKHFQQLEKRAKRK